MIGQRTQVGRNGAGHHAPGAGVRKDPRGDNRTATLALGMRAEPGRTVAARVIATTAALILSALACVDMPVTPMVDDSSLTVPDEGLPAMQAAAASDLAPGQLVARSEVCGTVLLNRIVMYDERVFHPAKTPSVGTTGGDWDGLWRLGPNQIRHYTFYRPASNTTNPQPPIGDWAQSTAVQYRRWGGDRTDYSYPVTLQLWDIVVASYETLRIEYQHYNFDFESNTPNNTRSDYWLAKSFVDDHPTADKVIRNSRTHNGVDQVQVTTNCTLTNILRYSSRPHLEIVSDPGPDKTYTAGDTIRILAYFGKPVEATGDATLRIRFAPNFPDKAATLNEDLSEGRNVYFDWVVREPNFSPVGVGVPSSELARRSIQGGKIVLRDDWIPGPAYPVDADDKVEIPVLRSYRALPHDPNHRVNWEGSSGARITDVSIVSDPGPDNTYILGDIITVALDFDRAVTVSGSPSIKIDMDPAESWGEKQVPYVSGSGTTRLSFQHEVVWPNYAPQGVAIVENSLSGGGGSSADLPHPGRPHDPRHKVHWEGSPDGSAASVERVSIVSDPGPDDFYVMGDRIRVGVRFDAAVDVSGQPQIDIDMDPADWGTKSAVYESGSGTSCLVFVHEVVQPNWSPNGIAVLANTLAGAITSGGRSANLGHRRLNYDSNHKVDWTRSDSDGNTSGSCPN